MKDAQSIANKEIAIAKTAKVISRADAPEEWAEWWEEKEDEEDDDEELSGAKKHFGSSSTFS